MSNILIVGANRGIGYYMAIRLLEKGNNVTVLDIQDDHISELKKRYQNSLLIIRSDATDEDSLSEGIKINQRIWKCRYSNSQCVSLYVC